MLSRINLDKCLLTLPRNECHYLQKDRNVERIHVNENGISVIGRVLACKKTLENEDDWKKLPLHPSLRLTNLLLTTGYAVFSDSIL